MYAVVFSLCLTIKQNRTKSFAERLEEDRPLIPQASVQRQTSRSLLGPRNLYLSHAPSGDPDAGGSIDHTLRNMKRY